MRLNPACIRAILLFVEEGSSYNKSADYSISDSHTGVFKGFDHQEIIYHIQQCEASGLICDVRYCDGGTHIFIYDLTPLGHEFLANARNDNIWSKIISKGAGASLPVLMEIAKDIALKYFLG